jgi:hypothetical protein
VFYFFVFVHDDYIKILSARHSVRPFALRCAKISTLVRTDFPLLQNIFTLQLPELCNVLKKSVVSSVNLKTYFCLFLNDR